MPYLKKVERSHSCIKPTGPISGHRGGGKAGVGSIWQCPECLRCYEVQPLPGQGEKVSWIEIPLDLARNLATFPPGPDYDWTNWKHPYVTISLEKFDDKEEELLVARLIVHGRGDSVVDAFLSSTDPGGPGDAVESFVKYWKHETLDDGFGFVVKPGVKFTEEVEGES